MLLHTDLQMAGYNGDQRAQMQRRMLDAVAAIPGVTAVGYADRLALSIGGNDSSVYRDTATDYRPTNSVADAQQFNVSPDYFRAAGTTLLSGRNFTLHDDTKVPTVAVVNREFARKVLGSVDRAIGSHFKVWNGTRVEVVGVVEDGKYETLTEDQQPAMFYSFLQQLNTNTWLIVRSERAPQEIAAALQQSMHSLDPGLPLEIKTWNTELGSALFAARVATVALGVMGLLGAMLAITGIFGMASYVVTKRLREFGIRVALGANQGNVLSAALGAGLPAAGDWLRGGHDPRGTGRACAFLHRLSSNAERPDRARRRDPDHAIRRLARGLDSGPACARGRPNDPAARGVRSYRSLFPTLASASFSAVSSASSALTFTSGSTPTPSQSALPKGLIAFCSGMPMPKWSSMRWKTPAWAPPRVVSPTSVARFSIFRS